MSVTAGVGVLWVRLAGGAPHWCCLVYLEKGQLWEIAYWDRNTLSSLSEQEQYHFCYDIALEYLESLETR